MIEEESVYVYVLMSDGDQTMKSCCTPFGVAVDTEEEAKRWLNEELEKDGGCEYWSEYKKLRVFKNKDEAVHWAYHTPEGRANDR